MRAFLWACLAILVVGGGGYFVLGSLQQPSGDAFATDGARIDPGWAWRSVSAPSGASETAQRRAEEMEKPPLRAGIEAGRGLGEAEMQSHRYKVFSFDHLGIEAFRPGANLRPFDVVLGQIAVNLGMGGRGMGFGRPGGGRPGGPDGGGPDGQLGRA